MDQPQSPGSWWLRLSLRFAATPTGAWVLSRVLPRIETIVEVLSGGQLTFPDVMRWFGAPIVELTTTGAKSGKDRTVPVLGVPDDGDWIVVASNWGRDRHPAWYHNLKANPEVAVAYRNQHATYEVREVTDDEREQYWEKVTTVNPGLPTYQSRASPREIPIIVLTPTTLEDGSTTTAE